MLETIGYAEPLVQETSLGSEERKSRATQVEKAHATAEKPLEDERVDVSPESRAAYDSRQDESENPEEEELTTEQKREVTRLQETDRKVRAHESAHVNAGAGLIRGGPYYNYETGPDGKRYAVGGRVEIDHEPEDDPESTIRKMKRVKNAALAGSEASSEDQQVAAKAQRHESEAKAELLKEQGEQRQQAATEKTDGGKEQSDPEPIKAYGLSNPASGGFRTSV